MNKMTNTFPETSDISHPIRRPITIPVIVKRKTVFKRLGKVGPSLCSCMATMVQEQHERVVGKTVRREIPRTPAGALPPGNWFTVR
jgi:hypothetical protein